MMPTLWLLIFLGIAFGVLGAWLKTTCPNRKGRLPEDIQ